MNNPLVRPPDAPNRAHAPDRQTSQAKNFSRVSAPADTRARRLQSLERRGVKPAKGWARRVPYHPRRSVFHKNPVESILQGDPLLHNYDLPMHEPGTLDCLLVFDERAAGFANAGGLRVALFPALDGIELRDDHNAPDESLYALFNALTFRLDGVNPGPQLRDVTLNSSHRGGFIGAHSGP
ncbi:hypothetical protein C2E23DRAFT_905655 [Lenzites betulinus]|nr:hypothetical protein C2E23DRAFT_905655 [Lenzites betulinus]